MESDKINPVKQKGIISPSWRGILFSLRRRVVGRVFGSGDSDS
jgi:hypothetical protein